MPDMGDYSTRTWPPLNDARVLLMLEAVAKDLVKIVDSQILAGFNRYRSAYFFDRAHPGTDARKELSVEYEKLEKAIEAARGSVTRFSGTRQADLNWPTGHRALAEPTRDPGAALSR